MSIYLSQPYVAEKYKFLGISMTATNQKRSQIAIFEYSRVWEEK